MYKSPKNPIAIELTKSYKRRTVNLGTIKVIYVELPDQTSERRCAWCTEVAVKGNRKYCGDECATSAMAWAYPQKEDALRFLLVRQGFKCLVCQYDYFPAFAKIMARDKINPDRDLSNLPWWYFKRLKEQVSAERKPEIDHILAISKGGASLGLDNHQAICYTCHKMKTKIDNSGPRKKG